MCFYCSSMTSLTSMPQDFFIPAAYMDPVFQSLWMNGKLSSRINPPRKRLTNRAVLLVFSGATPLEDDVDNFEHVLKMTTHNDALYAYYYTDSNTNKVKVTEIFDFDEITEHDKLATDLQIYEGSVEDHPNPHQHSHNTVVSEWNGVESGWYL